MVSSYWVAGPEEWGVRSHMKGGRVSIQETFRSELSTEGISMTLSSIILHSPWEEHRVFLFPFRIYDRQKMLGLKPNWKHNEHFGFIKTGNPDMLRMTMFLSSRNTITAQLNHKLLTKYIWKSLYIWRLMHIT